MIEWLIAAIISVQDCTPASDSLNIEAWDSWISTKLLLEHGACTVFVEDIPEAYHDHIRASAESGGWTVLVEKVVDPMYPSYKTTYKFTFIPM